MSTVGLLLERASRLRMAREASGLTAKDAAAKFGVGYNTYIQHENGNRGIPKDNIEPYARGLGVDPVWLLSGRGAGPGNTKAPTPRLVPLVGYVGAGSEAHFYGQGDENLDWVESPPGSTPSTRAALIRGESLGPLFDSWLVFYDDVRDPVTSDLIGRLCVVGLPNGKVLVKKLQKVRGEENRFHLLSNNEEPMFDQEVAWAARVKTMTPR